MSYRTAMADDVAKAITELTYSELMAISVSLRDMVEDGDFDTKNEKSWADLLNSWAEANIKDEE